MASELHQKRIALKLCVKCGSERVGDNCTPRCCARCAQKQRDKARKKRDVHPEYNATHLKKRYVARKAAGLCVQCGKKRTGLQSTSIFCAPCAKYHYAAGIASRQRERNRKRGYTPGDGRNAKPLPMGAASTAKREGGAWYFSLPLDTPSYEAIQVIRKRYRDAEYKAGREPLTHQNSRLVREIILRYEPSRAGVTPRKHRLLTDWKIHLSLDGRTRAIVERHANKTFDGNLSATLRAMLIQSQGFRRAFTGRG